MMQLVCMQMQLSRHCLWNRIKNIISAWQWMKPMNVLGQLQLGFKLTPMFQLLFYATTRNARNILPLGGLT